MEEARVLTLADATTEWLLVFPNPPVGGTDRGDPGVSDVGSIDFCSGCDEGDGNGKDIDVTGSLTSSAGVSTSIVVESRLLVSSLGRRFVNLLRPVGVDNPVVATGEGE